MHTTHTFCFGGFIGPGGSQLEGNWSHGNDVVGGGERVESLPSLSILQVAK